MILWRHLDDPKENWVYHANRDVADRELERLAVVNCATVASRRFYRHQRDLGRVDVWVPDSKANLARMMNKVERGEEIKWLR